MCNKQKVSRILVTYMSALGYIFYAAASWQPKALYWRGNGSHLLKLISKKRKKGTSEITIQPPPRINKNWKSCNRHQLLRLLRMNVLYLSTNQTFLIKSKHQMSFQVRLRSSQVHVRLWCAVLCKHLTSTIIASILRQMNSIHYTHADPQVIS